ncbi:MAG: alpha/beta fold hydrolase [Gordonia sp. (in: high G+C Gram-positive bacteria)]|uniref:alpha/beta fold hydrolase n=1 Tax=Gordonia sp. (in: high G+C Gram-positive bacteria) TaxID=84139 RepID=UPI003BB55A7C
MSVVIEANGLAFQAETAGDQTSPVLLLHGFPQDSTAWADVMRILADRGYGSVAPDLRGYSPGQQALPRSAYSVPTLVDDVVGILETYGRPLHVVGHDWGGSLLWSVRRLRPDLLASATIVSSPHPADLAWAATHSSQSLRSWYIGAIAIPGLPEMAIRAGLSGFLARTGLPAARADYYQARMREPGVATAALAWYRQMLIDTVRPPAAPALPAVDSYPPTQYLWGTKDAFLGRAAAYRTRDRIKDIAFTEVDGGHWLPETHPDLIADHVISIRS